MNEEKTGKRPYCRPECKVIVLSGVTHILAGSPPITTQPIVTPGFSDDGKEELGGEEEGTSSPAKRNNLWE
ncbi:MAG: hypothetical protein SPI30_07155 [Prevotella sp.]|nr:hypothetical protein [Prevotella sp.]